MDTGCRCIISGIVQGVGFRYWTRDTARSLNLQGWVRNLPDGTVELEAFGPEDSLRTLQDLLHEGPPYSRVTEVRCVPCPRPGSLSMADSPASGSSARFIIRA